MQECGESQGAAVPKEITGATSANSEKQLGTGVNEGFAHTEECRQGGRVGNFERKWAKRRLPPVGDIEIE